MHQQQLIPDEVARFRQQFQLKGLSPDVIVAFQSIILAHHDARGRKFPFREPAHYNDPYKVVVSEIMLQQTQADRVVEKYLAFLDMFPDFKALAGATNEDVLKAWLGLGYNRRALALKTIAERVVAEFGGSVPRRPDELRQFKGIGPNTAASIATFAFNDAVPFIETNVRAVYGHFFFHGQDAVPDSEILALVDKTLDRSNPRRWFYALMDYGVLLKKRKAPAPGKKVKQSTFKGSAREARGRILKAVIGGQKSFQELVEATGKMPAETRSIVDQLVSEGFLDKDGEFFKIK